MGSLYQALALLIVGVILVAIQWLQRREAKADGKAIANGRAAEVVAKAEAAIAQAEVEAPSTKAGVVDKLNRGEF